MQYLEKLFVVIFSLILSYGCEKEKSKEEVFTKSERQKFEFSAPGVGFSGGSPTLVNNYLYIGTSIGLTYTPSPKNYFYKLGLSLNKIWEHSLGNQQIRGSASLDDFGNIYFVIDSGRTSMSSSVVLKLYSLDNNGNFRWSRNIGETDNVACMRSVAISADNTIYVGGDTFFAFDKDGNMKWNRTLYVPGFMRTSPIIDLNGNIYFAAFDKVYSLDKNGNDRWVYTASTPTSLSLGLSSPAFTKDYSNLIIAIDKTLYALNTSNGALNWEYKFNINADFRSSPAVDDFDNIYIGSHGNGGEKDESTLYAVKPDGSGLLWQFNLGSDIYSSPTLGDDRVLYIGSEGHGNTDNNLNRLHAFKMSDGSRLWSAPLEMDITWGSPILSENGILYVSTMYVDGGNPAGVFGFQTDSKGLLPNCGSPTFQLSNAHTGRR